MYSFADFHAHSVGKQDDFVTQSSFLSFLLPLPCNAQTPPCLEGEAGRGGGRARARRKDGRREARASKSNFLFLKKERPKQREGGSIEGPKEEGGEGEEQTRRKRKRPKRGKEEVLLARLPCPPARLAPACLIATLLPSFLFISCIAGSPARKIRMT